MQKNRLPFRSRGGRRPGAGRKPKGARPGVPHRTRAPLASRYPVHVTTRLLAGLPNLRRMAENDVLQRAFALGCERFGMRLIEYSIQSNHLHLILEARDRRAVSRGLQGLFVRVAKRLNRLWDRRGTVFADRYHDRILRTPREVRNALRYVLLNARKHGQRFHGLDPHSSGSWFDGWRGVRPRDHRWLPAARTWLLAIGWRRHGRIGPLETPG